VLIRIGYAYQWTGFGQSEVNEKVRPSKTFWDWLKLLIVPLVLAIGGYLFSRSENHRAQDIANQQAETDRQIAAQGRQDDTLQAYLDQIGQMLLDKDMPLLILFPYKEDDVVRSEVKSLARARTLTVLARLEGERTGERTGARKGSVVQFLYESSLLSKDDRISLRGADLSEAILDRTDLSEANLSEANLRGANLRGTDLSWANLSDTNLRGANLSEAILHRTDLRDADLSKAILLKANMNEADLRGANLCRAHLTGAFEPTRDGSQRLISNEELEQRAKSLEGATMPNGQKYEDWLKDKEGREEDETTPSPQ